ncbi:MAG: arylsulfatase [Opitutus sp.]
MRLRPDKALIPSPPGFFLWVILFATVLMVRAEATRRPNIVIMLADDQGWGDLSINGNHSISTPSIDALAKSGATLDHFFVCAVCAPTRAEFLTGRYHPRGGVRGVDAGEERLNSDETTVAQAFKAAGYATGAFGKWHSGGQWPYHPNARGFEEFYGYTAGHWGEYFESPLEHNGEFVHAKGYLTDDLTSHAIGFIEKNKDRPFFCYLPFNTPHSPFSVPDKYWNRVKDRPIALRGPDGASEDLAVTRSVLAMCENIDENVGRVLRRLDELKLSDNTIVIYFSDNGPNSWRWNGGMKGKKGSVDEGGVRTAFFIRWPGKIAPGAKIPEIASGIDLLPTLVHLAGISFTPPKPLDGKDLSPLLLGTANAWPEREIVSYQNGKVSVRNQRHRLDPAGALYDLNADPGQKRNVANENRAVTARLTAAAAAWRSDVLGDVKSQGKIRDDRPLPVGYPEFPQTSLPAGDGKPHGGMERSSIWPNCSYFTHWKTSEDSITWDMDVHTAGVYDTAVYYTCGPSDVGSTIELSFNRQTATGTVTPAWDPPLNGDKDRVPRDESYVKDFHPLSLGTMYLGAGRGILTLRALTIPGKNVADVQMVVLTLRRAAPGNPAQSVTVTTSAVRSK